MVDTSIGTTWGISATLPATYDALGYGALTLLTVGEITAIPQNGPTTEVVKHTPLVDGITQKFHGATDYGSITIPLGISRADTGQVALRAAQISRDRVAFGTTFPDGTVVFKCGKVMSFTTGAEVGGIVNGEVLVEYETAEVTVAP